MKYRHIAILFLCAAIVLTASSAYAWTYNPHEGMPYPLNEELRGYNNSFLGVGEIVFKHKVTFSNSPDGKIIYHYFYEIRYSENAVMPKTFLRWTILDKVLSYEGYPVSFPLFMLNKENQFFQLEFDSDETPVWSSEEQILIWQESWREGGERGKSVAVLGKRTVSLKTNHPENMLHNVNGPHDFLWGPLPPSLLRLKK